MTTRATLRSIFALLALGASGSSVALAQETWTKVETKISTQVRLNAVTWAGARFAAGGSQGVFAKSSDGLDWVTTFPTGRNRDSIVGICWTGTRIVLGVNPTWGESIDSNIYNSPDGEFWKSTFLKSSPLTGVRWTGGRTVYLANYGMASGTRISPDSPSDFSWWASFYKPLFTLRSITSAGPLRIFVGDSGQVAISSDDSAWMMLRSSSAAWTQRTAGTTRNLLDIVHAGSEFVVVGEKGTILTTTDGATWAPQASGTTRTLRSVVWTGTTLVAVGDSGTILTSPDGLSWTPRSSPTTANLRSVAWSGSRFVAVGDSATILTSTSLVTAVDLRNAWTTKGMVARSSAGKLVFELPAPLTNAPISITLRDLSGRTMWSSTNVAQEVLEIAMPSLSAGIYRVVVDGAGKRHSSMVRWMP